MAEKLFYLKAMGIFFIGAALIAGTVFLLLWQGQSGDLDPGLALRAEKSKILDFTEISPATTIDVVDGSERNAAQSQEMIIKYHYVSDAVVPADTLDKKASQIVENFTQGTTTPLSEVYEYPAEDISKRTNNVKQYKVAKTVEGKEVWVAKTYSGTPFYKDGDDWYQIETATTTKVAFEKQMAPTLAERVKMFFGQKVYADSYPASTADGHVRNTNNISWNTAHDAATGNQVTDNGVYVLLGYNNFITSAFTIYRGFFTYSLAGVSGTVVSATEYMYGYTTAFAGTTEVQKSTAADTLTTADYDSFSGTLYGSLPSITFEQYNSVTYNALGVSDVQAALGSSFKTCWRDNEYDYPDSASSNARAAAAYSTETDGTSMDPYLEITFVSTDPPLPPARMGNDVKLKRGVIFNAE